MNKTDAKVYKALAECGFEFGHDLPKDDLDYLFNVATQPDEIVLEQVQLLFEMQDEDVKKYAKSTHWENVDLTDKTERTKKSVRNKNNDILAKMLNHFNIRYKRKKVKDILKDKQIPDYELGVVVEDRHANYHNNGFTGGALGIDTNKDMTLEEAFWFITNHKSKRKNIREQINSLLK